MSSRVPRDSVDDVVAEVFLVAWQRRHALAADWAGGWLTRVAENVIRAERRRARHRSALIDQLMNKPATSSAETAADSAGADVCHQLRSAFELLSRSDREILLLVAWSGLTHTDLARQLEISVNAATVRLHRARWRLARAIE